MPLEFFNLLRDEGAEHLEEYLQLRSYISGWSPSQADVTVFKALDKPDPRPLVNTYRWYIHIESFTEEERKTWPKGEQVLLEDPEDEDDMDLFGSDDEEDVEAAAKEAERTRLYHEALAKKKNKGDVAKSQIVLDIKPFDDETPLEEMERLVRAIEMDGLLWGASKFVEVAFGIKKLVITCVVEDEKCGSDYIEEKIEEIDIIQSMDVASFSKI